MILDVGRFVIEAAFAKSGTWGSNNPERYESNIICIKIIGDGRHKALAIMFLPFMLIIGYVTKETS